MYIFWDNSNIQLVGRNNVRRIKEPRTNPNLFRTYFKNLFELVRNNRTVTKAYMVGSVPTKDDSLWSHIRKLGIQLELLERTGRNKENAVDVTIQTSMLRTIIDEKPGTIALLTGDGSGNRVGKGFLSDIERAVKLGWDIEVYSWENGSNRHLKEYAQKAGKFIALEDYYYQITFIKNARVVAPLHIK